MTFAEINPTILELATNLLDEFSWSFSDNRIAREHLLAERLQETFNAEVMDLRRAEAQRVVKAMQESE